MARHEADTGTAPAPKTKQARANKEPEIGALSTLAHRLWQTCDGEVSARFREAGVDLTPRQRLILSAVERLAQKGAGPNQTTIEDRTGVDRSTLSDVIRRLARKGYLTRKRARADARSYCVTLTPKGRDALVDSAVIMDQAERAMLARGSDARRILDQIAELRDS